MDHEKYMHMHGGGMSSMKKATYEIALKGKKQIAEGTMAFIFEKPEGFTFKAGQHLRMSLINPPETDSEGDSRFFSLASTPQDPVIVIAMRMRDTAFKRVIKKMKVGEKVSIQIMLGVPHGAFALHEDSARPAIFIVGGIGIVPAFSMIKDATEKKLPHKMFLFYSNRRPQDAPFLEELQKLAKQNPSFKLIVTMTDAEKPALIKSVSSQTWNGETGRIDKAMLTKYVKDFTSPKYYLSGLPEMTSAMKKMLTDIGVKEDNINAEEFTGFNLNEINTVNLPHPLKRHILVGAILLVVIAVGILHVTAAGSLPKVFSLTNPILYLLIGLMLIVIPFKFKHILWLVNGKRNDTTHNTKNYSCPMHPEVVSDKPGQCLSCGMALIEKNEMQKTMAHQIGNILKVPGARLSYKTYGSGPVLFMIPGASGSGDSFKRVVTYLADQYTVVTYDRRGFSRSELDGPQDYDRRLQTEADDVRRLIEHVTDKPAIIFGGSSGAIIGLESLPAILPLF